MHVKTLKSMFKMQTGNHNFRKNVARKIRKMSLKFQNSKYDISCKIAFYIFFCHNSLELRGQ